MVTHISWWLAALVVIAVLSLAEALLRSGPLLALGIAAVAAAYGLGRRHGRRRGQARLAAIAARLAEIAPDGRTR